MNNDNVEHKIEKRNEIIEEENLVGIRIYDDKIEEVTKRMTEMGIGKEKAKTELKMMIIMGMMTNRHREQEVNDE